MVPFHESDVGTERWAKAEWEHVELWEKIEARLKRRRRAWIAGALVIFFILSAVPVWMDRQPKWQALKISTRLGLLLSQLKTQVAIDSGAVRVRLANEGNRVTVEKGESCAASSFSPIPAPFELSLDGFTFASADLAQKLDLPGLRTTFCFDAVQGVSDSADDNSRGVGILPSADLETGRTDRMAVLFWRGASGEFSFE